MAPICAPPSATGLTGSLHARSGLTATRRSLELTAQNVANADNPDYSRRTLTQGELILTQDLTIDALVTRAHDPAVKEVILALNATVDGQTTAHFITDLLAHLPLKVTRLAHGVPVGGELDYLDDGTLAAAIRQRTGF